MVILLILVSENSLLIYQKYSWVLYNILESTQLSCTHILVSGGFCCYYILWDFPCRWPYHLQSFWSACLLPFPPLFQWLKLLTLCWIKVVRVDILAFLLVLWGKQINSFHQKAQCCYWFLLYMFFIKLRKLLFIPIFSKVFMMHVVSF